MRNVNVINDRRRNGKRRTLRWLAAFRSCRSSKVVRDDSVIDDCRRGSVRKTLRWFLDRLRKCVVVGDVNVIKML